MKPLAVHPLLGKLLVEQSFLPASSREDCHDFDGERARRCDFSCSALDIKASAYFTIAGGF